MYAVKVKHSAAVAPCSTPRRRCLSNRIAVPGYAPKIRLDTKAVPKSIICGSSPHGAAETVVSSDDKRTLVKNIRFLIEHGHTTGGISETISDLAVGLQGICVTETSCYCSLFG